MASSTVTGIGAAAGLIFLVILIICLRCGLYICVAGCCKLCFLALSPNDKKKKQSKVKSPEPEIKTEYIFVTNEPHATIPQYPVPRGSHPTGYNHNHLSHPEQQHRYPAQSYPAQNFPTQIYPPQSYPAQHQKHPAQNYYGKKYDPKISQQAAHYGQSYTAANLEQHDNHHFNSYTNQKPPKTSYSYDYDHGQSRFNKPKKSAPASVWTVPQTQTPKPFTQASVNMPEPDY